MSFVGIVTRKEEDTGVDLEAKIVTANKKKSTKQRFTVRVKANALDDYTRCMLDNATAKNKILTMNDTNAIITDITASMMYSGEYDTKTSYKIQNQKEPLLSDYLSDNGVVLGRPKLGMEDAIGTLEITTKRGDASVTSRITVVVKQMTAYEVLEREELNQNEIWNTWVRGSNAPISASEENSGTMNILYKLNLIESIPVTEVADVPATLTWEVVDSTLPFSSAAYTDKRIDASGNVTRPDYSTACTLNTAMPDMCVFRQEGSSSGTGRNLYYRIKGLTLTCKISINEVTKTYSYNCATLSKYLTNKELADKVVEQIALIKEGSMYDLIKYPASASTLQTLDIPNATVQYVLKAFRNGVNMSIPEYGLTNGVDGIDITNTVKAVDGVSAYAKATSVFGGDFFKLDENFDTLTINCTALKSEDAQYLKFACVALLKVSGYSGDGLTPGGSTQEVKRTVSIAVNFTS